MEELIDGFLLISTQLKAAIAKLVEDGWSEEHARDIVITTYVAQARPKQ